MGDGSGRVRFNSSPYILSPALHKKVNDDGRTEISTHCGFYRREGVAHGVYAIKERQPVGDGVLIYPAPQRLSSLD